MFSVVIIRLSIIISCFVWLISPGIAAAKSNNYEIMVHGGQIEENTITYKEWYVDFITNLHHDFNEDFSGSLSIGLNANDRKWQDAYSRGRDFSIPTGFNNITNATDLYADNDIERRRSSAILFDLAGRLARTG